MKTERTPNTKYNLWTRILNVSVFVSIIILSLFCSGCGDNQKLRMEKIVVISGENQCAFINEPFKESLVIQVLGRGEGFWLGSELKGAPNEPLLVENSNESDLVIAEKKVVTDAGGIVRINIKNGGKTGDQYLKITSANNPQKSVLVRYISGIKVSGMDQETKANETLANPVEIFVQKSDGKPGSNVKIFLSNPYNAENKLKFERNEIVTDSEGYASVNAQVGNSTGVYGADVELLNAPFDNSLRTITVKELGINFYRLLINVFGGLAIFVFGMTLMSDGLNKAAGEKMRSILRFFSSNRYVGILAGAAVTAVIQSSSASTVMVIGFVNAGLLNLVQSIGIIFGANIGTTVTAQIVAFEVSSVSMPAIIIGLLLLFVTYRKMRGWGETILGFGMLFFGMMIMSNELNLVGQFPTFIEFFRSFDCAPVNGSIPFGSLMGAIGIGLLVTMIIQSSSASTGIIIALGGSGLINLYTAVALILGCNIGTTITAQLAAIPANRVAKQAALAHTLFNVLGVLFIVSTLWINWGHTNIPIFFYVVDMVTSGNAFADIPQNVPRHIANAHTIFNIVTTLLLIPFIALMARVCERIIPIKEKKIKYQYLEPHLLDTPAVALEQATTVLRKMLKRSWKMTDEAISENFLAGDITEEKVKSFAERENRIDRFQFEITDYLTQITRRVLSEDQSNMIPLLMHCVNDAERIADHTENIVGLTQRLKEQTGNMSEAARNELKNMYEQLSLQADLSIEILNSYDLEKMNRVLAYEREILRLSEVYEANSIKRLSSGKASALIGIIFVEMLGEYVKLSRHFSNIAERSSYLCDAERGLIKGKTEFNFAR